MTVAINTQLLNNIQECDVIHNFNKVEKKAQKEFNAKHAIDVVNTYIAISDDKLSREQIRRANRKPRKITHKTVEAREFMGIYN
jgi:uncharacterized protein YktA (UPF0223 family)